MSEMCPKCNRVIKNEVECGVSLTGRVNHAHKYECIIFREGRAEGIAEERERFMASYRQIPSEMYYLQTDSGKFIPQQIPSPSHVDNLLTNGPK